MATTPAVTPAPAARSGPGCLVALVLFPVVVIAGLVIGTALSNDDDPDTVVSVTLDEGTIDGVEWRVDAERDVDGDSCAFLYEDGSQLTGGCSLEPEDATFGDQTVVFGRADGDARQVTVVLSDGEAVDVDTVTAEGIEGRFYVEVVDGDVDAERLDG
jgi:hypothetical protein